LHQHPNLQHIRVQYIKYKLEDPQTVAHFPEIFIAPALNYLSLEWVEDADGLRQFLKLLRAPQLRSLLVLQNSEDISDGVSLFPDITTFIDASQADKLEHISVETRSSHPPSDAILNLLKLTPNVKEIRFLWPYAPDPKTGITHSLFKKTRDIFHLDWMLRPTHPIPLDDFIELLSSLFDGAAEQLGNLDVLKATISDRPSWVAYKNIERAEVIFVRNWCRFPCLRYEGLRIEIDFSD